MKSTKNNPFAPNDLEKDCDDDENIIESYVETLYDTEFQIPSSSQSFKFFVEKSLVEKSFFSKPMV